MQLRPYQLAAIEAIYKHLETKDTNPVAVIPTAGGKTPILATLARDAFGWGERTLIVSHVRELLSQAVEKISIVAPDLETRVGIYSAGLGEKESGLPITVAGIQSLYKNACEFDPFPSLIIIDEAHLVPPEGEGMYLSFLEDAKKLNPSVRVVGLTATPFRMKSGPICSPDSILNEIVYEVSVKELIKEGFLCNLISRAGREKVDTSELHIRAGEFVSGEAELLMDTDKLVNSAVSDILTHCSNRKSVLIFCAGVAHAKHVAKILKSKTESKVEMVFGDTLPFERDQSIADFKSGAVKFLVNVNVLTIGFDAPNTDCVVLLRPTMSPGLYYQMVGRGFRIHPGKENCLVLDFGGNVMRHGPVDRLRIKPRVVGDEKQEAPVKECPQCNALVLISYATCPDCGHEFPPPEKQVHDARAGNAPILSGETTKYPVDRVDYFVHKKRGSEPGAPRTMRVQYTAGMATFSEWVCLEHQGFAKVKANDWWKRRSKAPIPETIEEAVNMATNGAIAPTLEIGVRQEDKYARVVHYKIGEIPVWSVTAFEDKMVEINPEDESCPF